MVCLQLRLSTSWISVILGDYLEITINFIQVKMVLQICDFVIKYDYSSRENSTVYSSTEYILFSCCCDLLICFWLPLIEKAWYRLKISKIVQIINFVL